MASSYFSEGHSRSVDDFRSVDGVRAWVASLTDVLEPPEYLYEGTADGFLRLTRWIVCRIENPSLS
jgi:hypothetical protein